MFLRMVSGRDKVSLLLAKEGLYSRLYETQFRLGPEEKAQ
jgi:hypothetical protein